MSNIALKQIRIVAFKEFRERLRNRWVTVVALVFAGFALLIAYFGAAQQGVVGLRGIDVTIASLVSLVIYLVPLIVLILGYDAIVGERERGSLDLLLSLPITRLELLLGKFFGLSAALAVSTLAGFGIAGVMLMSQSSLAVLGHYFAFVLSAILMGMAFLSMAVMVSVIATNRTRASGAAIALWFFYVLVFDLLLLGMLVAGGGDVGGNALPYLLLLNPADVFRIMNVFGMEQIKTIYGLASVLPPGLANAWVLSGVLAFWVVVPLGIAAWRFK